MKHFLLLCLLSAGTTLLAQPAAVDSALVEWQLRWTNSRDYTLETLDRVPEADLTFRPTEDQMSFHAQLRHLAGNVYGLSERYLDHRPADYDREATRDRLRNEALTKAELATLLTEAYAFGAAAVAALPVARHGEIVEFFAGPKTRRQIVYLLQDHATHHRAQTLVYLRLLGHEPPRYRGW